MEDASEFSTDFTVTKIMRIVTDSGITREDTAGALLELLRGRDRAELVSLIYSLGDIVGQICRQAGKPIGPWLDDLDDCIARTQTSKGVSEIEDWLRDAPPA